MKAPTPPRIAGITPELSGFFQDISLSLKSLKGDVQQLDDTIADTRASLGLTDNRLSDVADQVGETGEQINQVGQSISDRVTAIEADYTRITWSLVRTGIASISIPSGAYDQEATGYAFESKADGWYRIFLLFNVNITSGAGILYLRCVTPQAVGWNERAEQIVVAGPATSPPISGAIATEWPLLASNTASGMFRAHFLVRLDAGETLRFFITKGGTLTQVGTIGNLTNVLNVNYVGAY